MHCFKVLMQMYDFFPEKMANFVTKFKEAAMKNILPPKSSLTDPA